MPLLSFDAFPPLLTTSLSHVVSITCIFSHIFIFTSSSFISLLISSLLSSLQTFLIFSSLCLSLVSHLFSSHLFFCFLCLTSLSFLCLFSLSHFSPHWSLLFLFAAFVPVFSPLSHCSLFQTFILSWRSVWSGRISFSLSFWRWAVGKTDFILCCCTACMVWVGMTFCAVVLHLGSHTYLPRSHSLH